jgi:L-rhamnose-H+ transport protein
MMFWMFIVILAGIMTGSFGLPMKYTTKWKWENTWAMWSIWTLLIIPLIVGFLTIPNLLDVLRQSGFPVVLKVFCFGLIWGVSAIAFGFGMHYLGLGLGYSLMMGMIITIGSLFPLLTGEFGHIEASRILIVIGAVVVILIGVVLSAWAAVIKEKDLRAGAPSQRPEKKSFAKGLLICLVAGVTAPFLNFAFVYGEKIRGTAVTLGRSQTVAPNAVWAVTLLGGFIVNLAYTLILVKKNKNWKLYFSKGTARYFFYTFLMGVMWAGSIILYGNAAANLGTMGASVGWAALNATGIVCANILGLLTREWKGVGPKGMRIMALGLAVLLIGIFLVKLA